MGVHFAITVTCMEDWPAGDCISHSLYLEWLNYIIQRCDNRLKESYS